MWWRTKGLFDSESGKQLHVGVVFIDVAPVSCYDVLGCLCVDVLEWSEVQLPVRSLLHSVFDISCSIFLCSIFRRGRISAVLFRSRLLSIQGCRVPYFPF
jgi:hypothetical protein